MLVIIWTLSFFYTMLDFMYSTFIHISFSHSFNFSYLSLDVFLNHNKKALHFSSSSSFRLHEKQMIYPRQESQSRFQHDTRQLQWSSRGQFRIRWQSSLATIQESNAQVAIRKFHHVNTSKMRCCNSIDSYVSATSTSWASGGLYCPRGVGWTRASAAGIQERIRFCVWMMQSTCQCIYLLEEGFK